MLGQIAARCVFGVGVVRMQADGVAIGINGIEESILRDKSTCQIVVRVKIVWLRAKRGIQIWYGLADSPRGQERRTQGIIGGSVLRAKTHCEFEVLARLGLRAAGLAHGRGG